MGTQVFFDLLTFWNAVSKYFDTHTFDFIPPLGERAQSLPVYLCSPRLKGIVRVPISNIPPSVSISQYSLTPSSCCSQSTHFHCVQSRNSIEDRTWQSDVCDTWSWSILLSVWHQTERLPEVGRPGVKEARRNWEREGEGSGSGTRESEKESGITIRKRHHATAKNVSHDRQD